MANFRFELNRAGVRELLKSAGVKKVIDQKAHEVYRRLPPGYGMASGETEQRVKATVGTRGRRSEKDNSENNSLLKALGGR